MPTTAATTTTTAAATMVASGKGSAVSASAPTAVDTSDWGSDGHDSCAVDRGLGSVFSQYVLEMLDKLFKSGDSDNWEHCTATPSRETLSKSRSKEGKAGGRRPSALSSRASGGHPFRRQ